MEEEWSLLTKTSGITTKGCPEHWTGLVGQQGVPSAFTAGFWLSTASETPGSTSRQRIVPQLVISKGSKYKSPLPNKIQVKHDKMEQVPEKIS